MSSEESWAAAEPEAPPAETGAPEAAEESAAESYSPEDSWATPQSVGERAERDLAAEETRVNAAENEADLREQDKLNGFSPQDFDFLNSPLPDPDAKADDATDAKTSMDDHDLGTSEDFQLHDLAHEKAKQGIVEDMNALLVNAGVDFTAEQLQEHMSNSEQFYAVENPGYKNKVETATYLATRRIAGELQETGYSKSDAYQAASGRVQAALWQYATVATLQGTNPAEVFSQAMDAELALHVPGADKAKAKPAMSLADVKDIESGQKASKSVAKGRAAPKGETYDAKQKRLSDMYEDGRHDEFFAEYDALPDWQP